MPEVTTTQIIRPPSVEAVRAWLVVLFSSLPTNRPGGCASRAEPQCWAAVGELIHGARTKQGSFARGARAQVLGKAARCAVLCTGPRTSERCAPFKEFP